MKRLVKIIIGIGLLLYIMFQATSLLTGPVVTIHEPQTGFVTEDPTITLRGNVANVSFLHVNDRKIYFDQNGYFEEKLILLPGYNILTVRVTDRFRRETVKTLEIVLTD